MKLLPALVALGLSLTASAPPAGGDAVGAERVSLDRLALRLSTLAMERGAQGPVAVWVHADTPELSRAFVTLLCADLSSRGLAAFPLDADTPERAETLARQQAATSLVRLTLVRSSHELQARGDLVGTHVNFWSGQTPTRPPVPAAALEQTLAVDAETVALGTPTPPSGAPMSLTAESFARLPLPTSAIAAGDLDGDGIDEIVALTDDELVVFSHDGKVLARRDHRGLPAAAVTSREPVGSVAIYRSPPRIAYFSARRSRGEVLELDRSRALRLVSLIDAVPLGGGDAVLSGAWVPGQNTLAPEIQRAGKPFSAKRPFISLSVFSGVELQSLVTYADGSALLQSPATPPRELTAVGAGSALADLDGDGRPEIVTSSAQFAPAPDAIRVLENGRDEKGPPVVRFQANVPQGRLLQMTPASAGSGISDLIAAVWLPDGTTELLRFRRAAR